MPSGYTASVADGSVTGLRQFALQCARGMGALVMMRDDAWDAPIPDRFGSSQYNAERLAEVQVQLADLRAMKPQEWQAAADAEVASRQTSFDKYRAEKAEQRARYDAMIAKVEAWEGAPEGIKSFMLEQLQSSRKFDCGGEDRWYEDLTPQTGEEWKATREQKLMKDAAYHAAEQQKENDRTEGRNAWIATLRQSLEGVS